MAVQGNRSEAYDLALFEPKEAKIVALAPNKKMEKAERRRTRVQSFLNAVVTLTVSALIIGVVSLLITSRVQLTEMNRTMNTCEKELAVLKSEQIRLEAELARQLSAQSVDEYAEREGMAALESNQIHYVTRGDGDEVEVVEENTGHWWDALFDAIAKIFS